MSDHSKPRRWTLVGRTKGEAVDDPRIEVLEPTRGPFVGHLRTLSVREDCITTADVEAVAKALSEKAYCDIAPEQYYDEARSLLARIFEGGER